jgi:hypothetical protein
MPVFLGGIDPLKLIETLLNVLIQKGYLTRQEAEQIVSSAKAPGQ